MENKKENKAKKFCCGCTCFGCASVIFIMIVSILAIFIILPSYLVETSVYKFFNNYNIDYDKNLQFIDKIDKLRKDIANLKNKSEIIERSFTAKEIESALNNKFQGYMLVKLDFKDNKMRIRGLINFPITVTFDFKIFLKVTYTEKDKEFFIKRQAKIEKLKVGNIDFMENRGFNTLNKGEEATLKQVIEVEEQYKLELLETKLEKDVFTFKARKLEGK